MDADGLEDNGEKLHGLSVECAHAVGLGGIEIDAVALVEHEHLLADGEFEAALGHHVKLLSLVGVLVQRLVLGFGLDGHHEGVGLAGTETAGKALVGVLLAALHAHALTLAGEEIEPVVGLLAKEEYIEGDAILLGDFLQVADGEFSLALFHLQIGFGVDAAQVCHFFGGDVEHVAQSLEALSYLFDCVIHHVGIEYWSE